MKDGNSQITFDDVLTMPEAKSEALEAVKGEIEHPDGSLHDVATAVGRIVCEDPEKIPAFLDAVAKIGQMNAEEKAVFEDRFRAISETEGIIEPKLSEEITPEMIDVIARAYDKRISYANTRLSNIMFLPDSPFKEPGDALCFDGCSGEPYLPVRIDDKGDQTIKAMIYTDRELSPFVGNVMKVITGIALASMTENQTFTPCYFDATMINRYMTNQTAETFKKANHGTTMLSDQRVKEIETAIDILRNVDIFCDYTNHVYWSEKERTDPNRQRIRRGKLISTVDDYTRVNGQRVILHKLVAMPPLLQYALDVKQLTPYEPLKIAVAKKSTIKKINVQFYLHGLIDGAKSRGLSSYEVTYQTVFAKCGIYHDKTSSRTQIMRDKDFIIDDFMKGWVNSGFLKGYEELPNSNGKERHKIKMFFDPEPKGEHTIKKPRKKAAKKKAED